MYSGGMIVVPGRESAEHLVRQDLPVGRLGDRQRTCGSSTSLLPSPIGVPSVRAAPMLNAIWLNPESTRWAPS